MYGVLILINLFFLVGIFKPMSWHKKIKLDNRWKNAGVFILIALIASPLSPKNQQPNQNATQIEKKKDITTPIQKKATQKVYSIGEEVNVSSRIFTVNDVEELDEVKDPMGTKYPAGDQARFIKINITVKNQKKQEQIITSDEIKLVSNNGTEYSTDETNEIWVNSTGQSFFLQPINPGVSKTANILFSIPKEIPLDNLKIKVSDGGLIDEVIKYIKIGT
jgi:hypothetical protein